MSGTMINKNFIKKNRTTGLAEPWINLLICLDRMMDANQKNNNNNNLEPSGFSGSNALWKGVWLGCQRRRANMDIYDWGLQTRIKYSCAIGYDETGLLIKLWLHTFIMPVDKQGSERDCCSSISVSDQLSYSTPNLHINSVNIGLVIDGMSNGYEMTRTCLIIIKKIWTDKV